MLYRAIFEHVDLERDPFTIDLLADDQMHVVQKVSTFGVWGRPVVKRESNWPFIYKPQSNGQDILDFGDFFQEFWDQDYPSPPERFGQCNISSRPLRIGEYYTFVMESQELEDAFRLIKLVSLEEASTSKS